MAARKRRLSCTGRYNYVPDQHIAEDPLEAPPEPSDFEPPTEEKMARSIMALNSSMRANRAEAAAAIGDVAVGVANIADVTGTIAATTAAVTIAARRMRAAVGIGIAGRDIVGIHRYSILINFLMHVKHL